MRHRVLKNNFGRKQGPRIALMRGLVDALVEHERIRTTLPKAKELRRYVEKAITKGKDQSVHATRQIAAKYPNKTTTQKIVKNLSVRFKERPGGYTRIIKLGNRPGDQAPMAFIEFVDYNGPVTAKPDEKEEVRVKRLLARKRAKFKKHKRKIQNLSRKNNRPT